MNYIKKNILTITLSIVLTFVFLIPLSSYGQITITPPTNSGITITPPTTTGQITNPLGNGISSIDGFIQTILVGALKIGIPVVALAIIYCGFLFVAARGKEEKITEAREALMYTLIGAAILLGSWALALLIKNTVLAL